MNAINTSMAFLGSSQHTAQTRRPPAPHLLSKAFTLAIIAQNSAPQPAKRDPEQIAAIREKYDPSHISPREIDQMLDALHAAGAGIDEGTTMLLTQGERFRSHIARAQGAEAEFDPTRAVNLVALSKETLEIAHLQGEDIAPWLDMLALFDLPSPAADPIFASRRQSA